MTPRARQELLLNYSAESAHIVKRWAWRKIVAGVAWSLVLLGFAPLGILCLWGVTHSSRPVSMPLPLKRGEYSSRFFLTELNEDYRIDIQWNDRSAQWKALDLDWRIVDDSGASLQQGAYDYRLRGNTAALGRYHSTRHLRQRIIVTNLQDAQGLELAHPKLEISMPERSLDMSYAAIYPIKLAFMVAAPGIHSAVPLDAPRDSFECSRLTSVFGHISGELS